MEVESYIKFGTIDSAEKNHSRASSNKSMMGTGVNITFGERFKKVFGAEYWTMAEPVDEDREVPHSGIALSGKFSYQFAPYNNTVIYPFVGLGLEQWNRNSPSFEECPRRFYGDLRFVDTFFGLGLKHKNLYFEVGGLLPFWSDTDTGHKPNGELGITLNAGILHKNINFGLFYSQKRFEGDGSQTDFQLEQYGFSIGYRF